MTIDELSGFSFSISVPDGFHGSDSSACYAFDDAEELGEWLNAEQVPEEWRRDVAHVDDLRRRLDRLGGDEALRHAFLRDGTEAEEELERRVQETGNSYDGPDSVIELVERGINLSAPDPLWLYKTRTFYNSSPALGAMPDLGLIGFDNAAMSASVLFVAATLDSEIHWRGSRHFMYGFPYQKEDLTEVGWGGVPSSTLPGIQFP